MVEDAGLVPTVGGGAKNRDKVIEDLIVRAPPARTPAHTLRAARYPGARICAREGGAVSPGGASARAA